MHEKEKQLHDQRLLEATRKGLMGLDGKLGCVVKYLGQPIMDQTASFYMPNEMYFPWREFEEEPTGKCGIPEADAEEGIMEIGRQFSGLSSGVNLEITYLEGEKELKAVFDGKLVFREVTGELKSYSPNKIWESKVEDFYVIAKKRELKAYEKEVQEYEEEKVVETNRFLQYLRDKWGI